jgi:hypothetical protein
MLVKQYDSIFLKRDRLGNIGYTRYKILMISNGFLTVLK